MHDLVVVDELILYPVYHLFKQALYLTLLLLVAVYGDCGHLLIRLNETFVVVLELLYLHATKYNIDELPVVAEKTFEDGGRDAMELNLVLSEAVCPF